MADKSFGVKDLNIVGASGDPTIESNGDLNLKAGQVAIQTNTTVTGVVTASSFVGDGSGLTGVTGTGSGIVIKDTNSLIGTAGTINFGDALSVSPASAGVVTVTAANTQLSTEEVQDIVGGMVDGGTETNITVTYNDTSGKLNFEASGGSVPANLTATTLDVSGICTAGSFVTDLTTGNGTDRSFAIRYTVGSNGASSYWFAGPGILNNMSNPTLYLQRGMTYIFNNTTGSSHPFRIQFQNTSTGVGTYVSGSQNGEQVFIIPHTAPGAYEYQCTIHGGMKGTFIIPS
tara:strand:+ start:3458 stop:4321 length:864 start_codon:yes stop_codon:yes gene_type:complete